MAVPKLYTIKQAASIVQVHYQTMRGWVESGSIRSVPVGLRRRIPEDALADFCQLERPSKEDIPARRTESQIQRELQEAKKRWNI